MKLEISEHIFEKYSNIKFHKHPPIGSKVIPCERMEENTKFYERA
jgi:hypothetical protein